MGLSRRINAKHVHSCVHSFGSHIDRIYDTTRLCKYFRYDEWIEKGVFSSPLCFSGMLSNGSNFIRYKRSFGRSCFIDQEMIVRRRSFIRNILRPYPFLRSLFVNESLLLIDKFQLKNCYTLKELVSLNKIWIAHFGGMPDRHETDDMHCGPSTCLVYHLNIKVRQTHETDQILQNV